MQSQQGWDYWGADQTAGWVQIPGTNNGEGTGFVDISEHFMKPSNVDKIRVVLSGAGDGGGLRSLRHVVLLCWLGEAEFADFA